MTLSSKLDLLIDNKNRIKQALEAKGAEVGNAPLSQYPQIIEGLKGGDDPIGRVATNKINSDQPGWLPADGSLFSAAAYPELASLLGTTVERDYTWETLGGIPSLGSSAASGCAYSPDGRYIAFGSNTSPYLYVIDTTDWSVIPDTPALPGQVQSLAFSPDGSHLAVGHASSPYLTVLETATWTARPDIPPSLGATNCVFSPDGRYLVTTKNSVPRIVVMDAAEWMVVSGPPSPPGNIGDCDFSPDGKYLVVAHATAPYVSLYNTSDWSLVDWTPPIASTGTACIFSPDGRFLHVRGLSGTSGAVVDMKTLLPVVDPANFSVSGGGRGAFSPDGRYMVVSGLTSTPFLRIYDTKDWSQVPIPPLSGRTNHCSFSPDGRFLAVGQNGAPYFAVVNVFTDTPTGYHSTPVIDPPTFGDTTVQPLIRAESI